MVEEIRITGNEKAKEKPTLKPEQKKQEEVSVILKQMREAAKSKPEEKKAAVEISPIPSPEEKEKTVIELKLSSFLNRELGEKHSVRVVKVDKTTSSLNASVQIDNSLYLFELDKTDYRPIAYKELT